MSTANPRLNKIAVLLVIVFGLLVTCHANASPFVVDNVIRIETQYANPTTPIAVSTYGPAKNEYECGQDAASKGYPDKTFYNNTCLHIMFKGPLPKGAVVIQPSARAEPVSVALIAVEYDATGKFIGAEALHAVHDADTCKAQATDIKDSNYKDGTVDKKNSLLIYCVGLPKWEPPQPDETVRWDLMPQCPWNPVDNNAAFQMRALYKGDAA